MACNYQQVQYREDGVAAGKAVIVCHLIGDQLWRAGPRTRPPASLTIAEAAAASEVTDTEDGATAPPQDGDASHTEQDAAAPATSEPSDGQSDAQCDSEQQQQQQPPHEPEQSSSQAAPADDATAPASHVTVVTVADSGTEANDAAADAAASALTAKQMDETLDRCFLQALKTLFCKPNATNDALVVDLSLLPVSASTFYSHHMMSCRPCAIDIKRSSYKKVGLQRGSCARSLLDRANV